MRNDTGEIDHSGFDRSFVRRTGHYALSLFTTSTGTFTASVFRNYSIDISISGAGTFSSDTAKERPIGLLDRSGLDRGAYAIKTTLIDESISGVGVISDPFIRRVYRIPLYFRGAGKFVERTKYTINLNFAGRGSLSPKLAYDVKLSIAGAGHTEIASEYPDRTFNLALSSTGAFTVDTFLAVRYINLNIDGVGRFAADTAQRGIVGLIDRGKLDRMGVPSYIQYYEWLNVTGIGTVTEPQFHRIINLSFSGKGTFLPEIDYDISLSIAGAGTTELIYGYRLPLSISGISEFDVPEVSIPERYLTLAFNGVGSTTAKIGYDIPLSISGLSGLAIIVDRFRHHEIYGAGVFETPTINRTILIDLIGKGVFDSKYGHDIRASIAGTGVFGDVDWEPGHSGELVGRASFTIPDISRTIIVTAESGVGSIAAELLIPQRNIDLSLSGISSGITATLRPSIVENIYGQSKDFTIDISIPHRLISTAIAGRGIFYDPVISRNITNIANLIVSGNVKRGMKDMMSAATFAFDKTSLLLSVQPFSDKLTFWMPDYNGNFHPVFVGFFPTSDTTHTEYGGNQSITAYDHSWYMTMQYLNDSEMVLLTQADLLKSLNKYIAFSYIPGTPAFSSGQQVFVPVVSPAVPDVGTINNVAVPPLYNMTVTGMTNFPVLAPPAYTYLKVGTTNIATVVAPVNLYVMGYKLYFTAVSYNPNVVKVGDFLTGETTKATCRVTALGNPLYVDSLTGMFDMVEQVRVGDTFVGYLSSLPEMITSATPTAITVPAYVTGLLGAAGSIAAGVWNKKSGVYPYRIIADWSSPAVSHSFYFEAKTTVRQAIEKICQDIKAIFMVKWLIVPALSTTEYIPCAYFVLESNVDDATLGLDLPAMVTITNPDPYLVTPITCNSKGEEKYNWVNVRCQGFNGKWYESVNGRSVPDTSGIGYGNVYDKDINPYGAGKKIEYYEEAKDIATQADCNARALDLYQYYQYMVVTYNATFLKRSDFELFQKLTFSGYTQIPDGVYRIISIEYDFADGGTTNQVSVILVSNAQFQSYLNLKRVYTDSIYESQNVIKDQLDKISTSEGGVVTNVDPSTGMVTVKTDAGLIKVVRAG